MSRIFHIKLSQTCTRAHQPSHDMIPWEIACPYDIKYTLTDVYEEAVTSGKSRSEFNLIGVYVTSSFQSYNA